VNLYRMLTERAEANNPVRVGLIGAAKFGTMFLAQARLTRGLHVVGVADINDARARRACRRTGWPDEQISASSLGDALKRGATRITDDAQDLVTTDEIVLHGQR